MTTSKTIKEIESLKKRIEYLSSIILAYRNLIKIHEESYMEGITDHDCH